MKKKSYLIPRRTFLTGVGAALALPSLDIMSPALSYAKAAGVNGQNNTRLCVLFKGAGVNPSAWDINGATETKFQLSRLLSPLEKNKKDIVILRNIDTDQRANGGHSNVTVTFMTGSTRKGRGARRESFDQVIASQVGKKTPIKSLQMRSDTYLDPNTGDYAENFLSYGADGSALPVEDSPEVLFSSLFRGFNNAAYRNRTTSVLDEVKASYASVASKASKQDKQVLEQYLDSVREVEKNIQQFKTQGNPKRDARLKQVKPVAAASDLPNRTKAMLDLTAMAFWTDMTRVATHMMAHTESRTVYKFLGLDDELHMLSHFVRTRNRSGGLSGYDKINMWYVSQFGYFLDKLKTLKDGDGTLFDNSIVLFGSGIKHGDYHSVSDLPLILGGGGGGQIKTGRYVKYPNVHNNNLHLKIMQMMGLNVSKYGQSTGALGGISEMGNFKPKYVDDGSWKIVKENGKEIEAKGMLTISVKPDDLNYYILRMSNKKSIDIRASFQDIHRTKMDASVGSVVHLIGQVSVKNGKKVITKVARCKRL
jgi:hypothetical protein